MKTKKKNVAAYYIVSYIYLVLAIQSDEFHLKVNLIVFTEGYPLVSVYDSSLKQMQTT